jgi:hypothetical protein
VIALIIIVVLLAVLGFWLWRRKQTADPAVTAAKQELSEHSKALKAARKERDDSIKNCQRQLAEAQKKHNQYVSSAQRKLTDLEDPKGKRLGSYHGVRLYERWIETPHGSGPVRDTVASVDSQIASRITATRLVTLGVFALAAKKKTGAIYLSIDNPALASVIECPKDDNTKARQFAVQITNASKAAPVIEEQLPALIEQAKADLKAYQEATRPIEFAQEELAAIEAEPAMLEAIRVEEAAVAVAQQKLAALTHGDTKKKAIAGSQEI